MSLFSVLSVSASGLQAECTRAALLMESLANSETIRTPEGGPTSAKTRSLSARRKAPGSRRYLKPSWVRGSTEWRFPMWWKTPEPDQPYIPGHTDPDSDDYVAYLRVNPAEDMLNLMDASRNFQANVAAMCAIKDMLLQSINFMK
jgi:flagellar basal-body rod protein FlgC